MAHNNNNFFGIKKGLNLKPSTLPVSGNLGDITFDISDAAFKQWNGTAWVVVLSSDFASAKGDLLVGTGAGTVDVLPVGSDNQALIADSAQTTGIKWGTLQIAGGGTGASTKAAAFDALSPLSTGGDLLYGGTSGTGTRLPNGTSGQFLKSNGGTAAPSWASVSTTSITVGARISSTGVVSGESQDFINGNASYTGGTCTITLNAFFATIASVQCTLIGDVTLGTLGAISVVSASTSTIVVATSTAGVGNTNQNFYITVTGT